MRVLPTIDGYTIDYRLQEFRRAVPSEGLTIVPFATEAGRALLREVWQDERLLMAHEGVDREAWVCACGNRPTEDGFVPCNWAGESVEPTLDAWPVPLYVCDRCHRVIDGDNLVIVSLAA